MSMARTPTRRERAVRSAHVLIEVADERRAQDEKWGERNHPNGTGPDLDIIDDIGYFPGEDGNAGLAECAKDRTDALSHVPGRVTWAHILTEEWAEAMAEDDPALLREELIQVAAVATQWVEAIDRAAARDHKKMLETP